MDYRNTIDGEIRDAIKERRDITDNITKQNNEFAEYLKQNFDGEISEIVEAEKQVVEKEKNKTKTRKFFEKIINIL